MDSRAVEAQASSRVSDYWETQFAKNRVDASLWTNNNVIGRHIKRLITDCEHHHWLLWFLNCYIPQDLLFQRSLSICCGDAAHELLLANSGRVKFISGFDISQGAVKQARGAFAAAGVDSASYRLDVADANEIPVNEPPDLILSTGALHHVTKLETVLARLRKVLSRDGYFVVLEYVGPNYFQWRKEQLKVINAVLEQLDSRYLRDGRRWYLSPPKLHEFQAIDPSEAIRSEDILPLLRKHFTIEYLREFNGTIMHPLYPLLNPDLTNAGARDFDNTLRLILLLEASLIEAGVLSSDFVFAICRPKRAKPTRTSGQVRRLKAAIVGYLDVFDENVVSGWAASLDSPETPLNVGIYLNGRLQASMPADLFRQDLLQAGYGSGKHGFVLPLKSRPTPGMVVRINVSGTNHMLAMRIFGQF